MALCWLAGCILSAKTTQRSELTFAAKNFNSVEINGTHYSLQRPEYFAQRAAETPDDFVFAVKGSRFITHIKKLRDVQDALASVFCTRGSATGQETGPGAVAVSTTVCIRSSEARDFLQNPAADDEASSSA